MTDTLKELRAAPRVPVNLTARYRSGPIVLHGTALNLSPQGMFFALDDPTPIFPEHEDGDATPEVSLEIDLLGTTLIAAGEVCWIDGARVGLGIRFTDIEAVDQERISSLLGLAE